METEVEYNCNFNRFTRLSVSCDAILKQCSKFWTVPFFEIHGND